MSFIVLKKTWILSQGDTINSFWVIILFEQSQIICWSTQCDILCLRLRTVQGLLFWQNFSLHVSCLYFAGDSGEPSGTTIAWIIFQSSQGLDDLWELHINSGFQGMGHSMKDPCLSPSYSSNLNWFSFRIEVWYKNRTIIEAWNEGSPMKSIPWTMMTLYEV